jgi:hypothetical protein
MNLKRYCSVPILFVGFMFFAALPGISQQSQPAKGKGSVAKVGPYGIMHKKVAAKEESVVPSPEYQAKKAVAERLDTAKLLYTGKVVTDSSPKMLEPPKTVAEFEGNGFVIAKEPPTVEFAVIPVDNLWLDQPTIISKSNVPNHSGPWANWANANYDSRTGKFYTAIGDHGMYAARVHLVEYDPAAKKVKTFPELNRAILGKKKDQFADGKIHGWLSFYKSRQLVRPHIWFSFFWTKYPHPDEEDFQTSFEGAHIMSCDPLTGDVVDYGVPLLRATWPYHRVDTKRGIFYAVGTPDPIFLAWDINEQKVKWAGALPQGLGWWERAILIDETTGMVYSTNSGNSPVADPDIHMLKYDPYKNSFTKLACTMPAEGRAQMRAHTWNRGPDGLFWCATYSGEMFTFDPAKEEVVDKGPVWPGKQRYTAAMDRSPGGRYVYYLPGAHGLGWSDGSPVVQYDTRTGARKVLAFMYPYYFEKYGYTPSGTFSIKLDDRGERLFVCWNGAFVEHNEGVKPEDTFGVCAVTVIDIPASERKE